MKFDCINHHIVGNMYNDPLYKITLKQLKEKFLDICLAFIGMYFILFTGCADGCSSTDSEEGEELAELCEEANMNIEDVLKKNYSGEVQNLLNKSGSNTADGAGSSSSCNGDAGIGSSGSSSSTDCSSSDSNVSSSSTTGSSSTEGSSVLVNGNSCLKEEQESSSKPNGIHTENDSSNSKSESAENSTENNKNEEKSIIVNGDCKEEISKDVNKLSEENKPIKNEEETDSKENSSSNDKSSVVATVEGYIGKGKSGGKGGKVKGKSAITTGLCGFLVLPVFFTFYYGSAYGLLII